MELPLGDVVSPQFAFPIVGVIVCALLVFAFGFKSPSLPPSFVDEEEIQRADAKKLAAKKKKQAKEAQKNKPQSNGHAPTVSPKAVPAPAKSKALEKAAAPAKQKTEKVDAKPQQPSKKVTQPEKRPAAKGKKAGEKEKAPAEAAAPLTAEESSDLKSSGDPSNDVKGVA
uniref:Putative muscle m-line assembly protein unc-89 n=1 Tax=Ixodes ricinus TaxID=34613 RepID=A0A147BHS9_IXORI